MPTPAEQLASLESLNETYKRASKAPWTAVLSGGVWKGVPTIDEPHHTRGAPGEGELFSIHADSTPYIDRFNRRLQELSQVKFTLLVVALVLTGCSLPPTPSMLDNRDRFVQAMRLDPQSVTCEPTHDWFGPPWECSAITKSGAPAKFWCAQEGCSWTTTK